MTYTATLAWDKESLADIRKAARQVPKLVKPAVATYVMPYVRRQVKKHLGTPPGPVVYPIDWTSEKQRRAFFATDGFGAGIPYEYTGRLTDAWQVSLDGSADGYGTVTVFNNNATAQFVQGKRQQRFHRNTGWEYAPDVLQALSLDAQAKMDKVWDIVCSAAAQGDIQL